MGELVSSNELEPAPPAFFAENEEDDDSSVLIPPLNFAMVAKGVYRSGYPNAKNHRFLAKLGLKSIL